MCTCGMSSCKHDDSHVGNFERGQNFERGNLASLLTNLRTKNTGTDYRRALDDIATAIGMVRETTVTYKVK